MDKLSERERHILLNILDEMVDLTFEQAKNILKAAQILLRERAIIRGTQDE